MKDPGNNLIPTLFREKHYFARDIDELKMEVARLENKL